MATSFQPEKPNSPSKETTGKSTIIWTAVIGALVVAMIFALVLPRFFWEGEVNWLIMLGASVLTLVIILAVGFSRRSGA